MELLGSFVIVAVTFEIGWACGAVLGSRRTGRPPFLPGPHATLRNPDV